MERLFGNRSQEFENEYCKFKPFDWKEIDGVLRPVIFKVVTSDLRSLGLRHNPTLLKFPVGEWIKLADSELLPTDEDEGGIWGALKRSGARTITKYMLSMYNVSTRTFLTTIDTPLYANNYRVKSRGVLLLEELTL
jgi:hypothetical protein